MLIFEESHLQGSQELLHKQNGYAFGEAWEMIISDCEEIYVQALVEGEFKEGRYNIVENNPNQTPQDKGQPGIESKPLSKETIDLITSIEELAERYIKRNPQNEEELDRLTSSAIALYYQGNWDPLYKIFDIYLRNELEIFLAKNNQDLDPEDAIQEIWTKIAVSKPKFKKAIFPFFAAYIYKSAKNLLADQYRGKRGRRMRAIRVNADKLPDYLGSLFVNFPEEEILNADLSHSLILGLQSREQIYALVMKYYLGLENTEIAICLGKTVGAAKALISRAKNTLQNNYPLK